MDKKIIAIFLAIMFVFSGFFYFADARTIRVKGYTKKSRTYVMPHYKTSPDRTRINNYSTKGNYNPYTGKKGTQPIFKPLK